MSITPSLLSKLKRCQCWFLRYTFFVPGYAANSLLLRISGLNSIESEIHILKRDLFFSRLITDPKMAPAVQKKSVHS